ncbi:hypothetical protein O1M63_06680 [Streptomyces mirabilis]|nr:hypothetical protein [Streptomyces mirabilis]
MRTRSPAAASPPSSRATPASASPARANRDRRCCALAARPPHVLVAHGAPGGGQLAAPAFAGGDLPLLTLGGPGRTDAAGRPAGGHLPATATAGQLASAVVLAAAGYTLVHGPTRPRPGAGRPPGPWRPSRRSAPTGSPTASARSWTCWPAACPTAR